MRSTYGWAEITEQRKREIVEAIAGGTVPRGPVHAELDLTDRCNVACYFCNQQDVRTKEFIDVGRVRELLDELAAGGLRSVRMSGGGDPLYHRNVLESLDMLAERVGIDGWEIRWRNALEVGDRFGTGQRLGPGVGIKATLEVVRDARFCRCWRRRIWLSMAVRMAAGGMFPDWDLLLAPLFQAALWPVAAWVLLAPQRRAPDPDENRPL